MQHFLKDEKYFNRLFSFLNKKEDLNPRNSSYFYKVVSDLMLNNLTEARIFI